MWLIICFCIVGSTISASIYIYIKFVPPIPGGKARVQNCVSGSCLGAVFKVMADEESEVWTICHVLLSREAYL